MVSIFEYILSFQSALFWGLQTEIYCSLCEIYCYVYKVFNICKLILMYMDNHRKMKSLKRQIKLMSNVSLIPRKYQALAYHSLVGDEH